MAPAASPSSSQNYADYTYFGAGTVIKVTHPAVSNGLELDYGTGGTYGGIDRSRASQRSAASQSSIGRVIDQKWENTAASTTFDRFKYGHDREP